MPSLDPVYPEIRRALEAQFPGLGSRSDEDPPFAAIVRAWLHRQIDPGKTAPAVQALRDAGLLEPAALAGADPSEVVEALRSGGATIAPKAVQPLRKLARWIQERGEDTLPEAPTAALRDELVALNGIGPGTADALLLWGLDRPVYPLDRGSYRIFARHGWIDLSADYDEARDVFERLEPDDPDGLRRLNLALEKVAAQFCKAARAKCERCPLRPFLPEGGPISGEE